MVQFCYSRLYLGIDSVSRRLLQWITRIENGLKLRPTKRYRTNRGFQQDKYATDSDNKSDEEGVYEVVYGRTCMTSSRRSVRFSSFQLHIMLPAQLTPSPVYPGLQAQVKERLVLVQYASSWQLCSPASHSSTNQQVKVSYKNFLDFNVCSCKHKQLIS